jgi:magnesium-transporting ATPase (P-type)
MPTPAVKTDSAFWQVPVSALLKQVATSPNGLSSAVAASRLAQFGPNLIHSERKRTLILQFLTPMRRGAFARGGERNCARSALDANANTAQSDKPYQSVGGA